MYIFLARVSALLTLATWASAQSPSHGGRAALFANLAHQAEAARDAKRFDEALTLFKRALALDPTWPDGWWNAGSIAYDSNQYKECASDFRRLAALKPQDAPAWTMKGLCEYELRDYEAALKSLTRVERMGFQETPELARAARLHLALVLTKLGYSEKAIVLLYRLTSVEEKKTDEIIVAVGIAGLRKPWIPPEVPESEKEKVLKLGDAMATYMAGGDVKGALDKFEVALREYPTEPDFHYRFGAFLLEQDPDRGIEEIKKTLDLEPDHIPALVALARTYLKRSEPQAALPYAQKAVKLGPQDLTARMALGDVLLATGDAAGAAGELEVVVRLAPESPAAHYSLARAYTKLGRKGDAARERDAFKKARQSVDAHRQ
jgi:tetratricopeptide (TPR) repeat protein